MPSRELRDISIEDVDERHRFRVQKGVVYQIRSRGVQDAKSELRLNSLEARVLWGDEAETAFREVNGCVQKLWAAIIVDMEFEARDPHETDRAELMERRGIMYSMAKTPEEDQFMVELNKAIERFERLARPHLVFERG